MQHLEGNIKILQLNCNRRPAVQTFLENDMANNNYDILLLQEPAANNNKVYFDRALACGNYFSRAEMKPRTCIVVSKKLKKSVTVVSQLTKNDSVAIRLRVKESNGSWLNLLICSVYIHDSLTPTQIEEHLKPLNEFASKHGLKLIMAGDFNCHHPAWGKDPDDHRARSRGEKLYEYICCQNLYIHNDGRHTYNKMTVNGIIESTIDLTLTNHLASELIVGWKTVENNYYGSDHIPIAFSTGRIRFHNQKVRNIRKLDDKKYKEQMENVPQEFEINSLEDLNNAANIVTDTLQRALENSCPWIYTSNSFKKPWYTTEMDTKRKQVWKANATVDEAIKNNLDISEIASLRRTYIELRDSYESEVKNAKELSFQEFASDIESIEEVARLTNIAKMVDEHSNITMKDSNGNYTNDPKETLELLVNHHFPCIDDNLELRQVAFDVNNLSAEDKQEIDNLVNSRVIEELIYEFESYKSPGPDGIYPIMLKCAADSVSGGLTDIIRFCLYSGVTPDIWLETKVVFLPKPGKNDYSTPKSFRPICLMSFLLKLIEKLVARLLQDKIDKLNKQQYAYRKNMSTVQALNDFSNAISRRLLRKTRKGKIVANRTTYASFCDIEGAFDSPKLERLKAALIKHGVQNYVINWIMNMNSNRIVNAVYCEENRKVKPLKGFAQGGVLSCLLWILYVDELLEELNQIKDIAVWSYSDDIAIASTGINEKSSQEALQKALNKIKEWCDRHELGLNPDKCVHMRFSRKRKFSVCNIKLCDKVIEFSSQVKYLGVIFDSQFTFRRHTEYIKNKITKYSWRLKTFIGNRWGITADRARWAYQMIVVPKIAYASSIYIHTMIQKKNIKIIQKAQNNAVRAMTCAIRTTPKLAMRAALGILSIENELKICATMELARLHNLKQWQPDSMDQIRVWQEENLRVVEHSSRCDWQKPEITSSIDASIPSDNDWRQGNIEIDGIPAYTDASVDTNNNRTGIGVYVPQLEIEYAGYARMTTSSFKAELLAINKLFSICLNRKIRNVNLNVITDSQSAIKALSGHQCRSKIQRGIKRQIEYLGRSNVKVMFTWIPAHTENAGVHFLGNQKADLLTRDKEATESNLLSMAPLTKKEMKENLRRKLIDEEVWPPTTHETSKAFKMDEMLARGEDLNEYSRYELTLILRFMTGFSCLAQHMKYVLDLDHTEEIFCRFCMVPGSKDSSIHLIENCSRFNTSRLRIFGEVRLNLQTSRLSSRDILRFIMINPTIRIRLMSWTETEEEAIEILNSNKQNSLRSYSQVVRERRQALQQR